MPKRREGWNGSALRVVAIVAAGVLAVVGCVWLVVGHDPAPAETAAGAKASEWLATHSPSPEPTGPLDVLWIGDSFTGGTGTPSRAQGEAALVGDAMGWNLKIDAEGSTGFVADGHALSPKYSPFTDRIPKHAAEDPDVVILEGGRNDALYPYDQAAAGVTATYDMVKKQWPDATIVTIAPYYLGDRPRPLGKRFLNLLATETEQADGHLIDPVAAGWAAESKGLLSKDKVHPSIAGHQYIAEQLGPELADLDLQPSE